MIIRERYLSKIRGFYEDDLVKVITGIRRSGKSVILRQIMDEIGSKTDNIIYLNFENFEDLAKVADFKGLISYVSNNRKEGKCYIFLDEIQELDDWQIAVRSLRLGENSIFITGSNSKLLSREVMANLSGRFIEFRARPFVYEEIQELAKDLKKEVSINDYIIWGGFPARFYYKSEEEEKEYLQSLKETIIYNDLIKRYRIKKEVAFKKLVDYILQSNSRIYSARNIFNVLNSECQDISLNTVLKYIEYLKNAYIIDEIPLYSTKKKNQLKYYSKVYNSDVSFNSLFVKNNRYDLDHNLENIVYNELLYKGYSVNVFRNKGREIDFYANKNGKSYYIQVAYSIVDDKAYKREMSSFEHVEDPLCEKIIITNDDIDYSTSLVRHIKFKDFLTVVKSPISLFP